MQPPPTNSPLNFPLPQIWMQWYQELNTLLKTGQFAIAETPASSSAVGTPGQITFDTTYLYVCVTANSWRRIAFSTF